MEEKDKQALARPLRQTWQPRVFISVQGQGSTCTVTKGGELGLRIHFNYVQGN